MMARSNIELTPWKAAASSTHGTAIGVLKGLGFLALCAFEVAWSDANKAATSNVARRARCGGDWSFDSMVSAAPKGGALALRARWNNATDNLKATLYYTFNGNSKDNL